MMLQIARREERQVGKYRVTLLYDQQDRVIGALVEGPRLSRPVYIAVNERAVPRIPKQVKKFLAKHGFQLS